MGHRISPKREMKQGERELEDRETEREGDREGRRERARESGIGTY